MTQPCWWWKTSVGISRMLCGPAGRPLCSRIYEARPALWRSVAMRLLDRAFRERDHCARVHRRWLDLSS